jgi:hypothetical protein
VTPSALVLMLMVWAVVIFFAGRFFWLVLRLEKKRDRDDGKPPGKI